MNPRLWSQRLFRSVLHAVSWLHLFTWALVEGFSRAARAIFFPYCFMLLFLHVFPYGLAPRSPDTDLSAGSHGMRLPPAQWITPPAPFLNLVLWLLVCVKEIQNSEHSEVDSGHLDTQSGLSSETHAQKLSSQSVCNAYAKLSMLQAAQRVSSMGPAHRIWSRSWWKVQGAGGQGRQWLVTVLTC